MNYPFLLYRGEEFNANFYYFAGCDIDHAFLLVDRDQKNSKISKKLFVPRMNETLARDSFSGIVIVYDDLFEKLKEHLKSRRIYVDGRAMSMRLFQKLSTFCRIRDFSDHFSAVRAVKKEGELRKIAKAVSITKDILASLDLSKMRTENDVKRFLFSETLERGAEPAFEPIVATDRNSSFPHYRGGNAKLGSSVLVDYGVKYDYYCADLTRCFFLTNSKKNKEREEIYEHLIEITNKIAANIKLFKTGREMAKYSEQLLANYKLPKLIHSIGHGIGLEVHEFPRLGKKSKDKLVKTTIAIEPAVYFRDYGLRYEDNIYFDGKSARIL